MRELKAGGYVRTARIEAAFQTVPRHAFLPNVPLRDAYDDRSYPTKISDGVAISSSSQPAIMAEMLEHVNPRPGERILEIGAGTGYNAALLAHLVGRTGSVTTVDIDEDIVAGARTHLSAASHPEVHVRCGEGTAGDAARAPFDAIIATVAIGDIPLPWIEQLARGGRLIAPLALGLVQRVVLLESTDDGLQSNAIIGGEFMTLRGHSAAAHFGSMATLGDAAVRMRTRGDRAANAAALRSALAGPSVDCAVSVALSIDDLWESFDLWLSLHEPAFCRLTAQGDAARSGVVPDASGRARASSYGLAATFGVCEESGLAVFALTPDGIDIRSFGDASVCRERLERALRSWHDAGRPNNGDLTIRVTPSADLSLRWSGASFSRRGGRRP